MIKMNTINQKINDLFKKYETFLEQTNNTISLYEYFTTQKEFGEDINSIIKSMKKPLQELGIYMDKALSDKYLDSELNNYEQNIRRVFIPYLKDVELAPKTEQIFYWIQKKHHVNTFAEVINVIVQGNIKEPVVAMWEDEGMIAPGYKTIFQQGYPHLYKNKNIKTE